MANSNLSPLDHTLSEMAMKVKADPSAARVLELLAPRFSDVDATTGSVPVALELSASLDVQLVFWDRAGVTKELGCVNMEEGCPRCKFDSFLRGLVILKRRRLLHINGAYVLGEQGFARLRLQIEGLEDVATTSELEEFDFVKSHLQTQSVQEAAETEQEQLKAARRSKCHIVGCKLHRWKTPRIHVTPERSRPRPCAPTPVPMAVQSPPLSSLSPPAELTSPMSRGSEASAPLKVESQVLEEPPSERKLNLPDVFQRLMARIEATPTDLWSGDVAGLDLRLYEHQRRGLSWMMKRERELLWDTVLLHPFSIPGKPIRENDRLFEKEFSGTAHDACGGMLCDEPGLGKTITMLALILLTKGQSTTNMPVRVDAPTAYTARIQLRSSSRGRSLQAENLVSSAASLIVAPDALVEHWAEQIGMHVEYGGLKTYVDRVENLTTALPKSETLARYDVVIVSFSRMNKEWKLHRPPSAMETRRTTRYGFENQPDRYLDGGLIGEISSLLLVHWLRVIVDEGHKLGGRAPTQLMQISRLLCAERRWVMTGTPSPNTLQSADLQYIHGLLVFLRNQPYGRPDGYAWSKAIARPFERNEIHGFYRLQNLLSRIMIRHTKDSIRDILPKPIRHTVVVDPTPSELKLYNALAEHVRASLVVTSIDLPKTAKSTRKNQRTPGTPGDVHPKSLLHRKKRNEATQVENGLAFAFVGGHAVEWVIKKERKKKVLEKLQKIVKNESRLSTVVEYVEAEFEKKKTICRECGLKRRFLMVLPCGHLCCGHCIEDLKQELGECCCNFCGKPYDEDEFDELQPTLTGEILPSGREKTIRTLRASGVDESKIERVAAYMDSRKPKPPTECRGCHRPFHLLLILPCGHLACADCVEKRFKDVGPSCCLCHEEYSRRGFRSLQPDIHPEPVNDDDQRRKKVSINKKRKKRASTSAKKSMRLVNYTRDFWRIESSKIFYMATRIRELMEECAHPSRGQQRNLKIIIFSQFRESIWRVKVAFKQQGIPTADFIALINPRERIANLEAFRSNSDRNVLLLSNLGSHGLDLSFVTHIFLLEEIWDKSVEMQVISRAHRMGASHSVVVEQLWIRGTVECQLTSANQQLFSSEHVSEDTESAQQHATREEVQEAASTDKSSFQQMKLHYILTNLRTLSDKMAGGDSEVRFFVRDESEAVIRQGVHTISESGDVTTVSTMPAPPQPPAISPAVTPAPASPARSSSSAGESVVPRRAPRAARRTPGSPEVIVIDDSSEEEEHKSESDSEDEWQPTTHRLIPQVKQESVKQEPVKQEPVYIEILDDDTESE
jgi:SNF2 family DNA or RNA helicase